MCVCVGGGGGGGGGDTVFPIYFLLGDPNFVQRRNFSELSGKTVNSKLRRVLFECTNLAQWRAVCCSSQPCCGTFCHYKGTTQAVAASISTDKGRLGGIKVRQCRSCSEHLLHFGERAAACSGPHVQTVSSTSRSFRGRRTDDRCGK